MFADHGRIRWRRHSQGVKCLAEKCRKVHVAWFNVHSVNDRVLRRRFEQVFSGAYEKCRILNAALCTTNVGLKRLGEFCPLEVV